MANEYKYISKIELLDAYLASARRYEGTSFTPQMDEMAAQILINKVDVGVGSSILPICILESLIQGAGIYRVVVGFEDVNVANNRVRNGVSRLNSTYLKELGYKVRAKRSGLASPALFHFGEINGEGE